MASRTASRTADGTGDGGRRRRPGRRAWLVAGGVVVLVGGYGAAAAVAADRVPSGTTVLGQDLGGLDREGAEQRLGEAFAAATAAPLPVEVAGGTQEVVPDEAGLRLDAAATADRLVGFSLDPRDLWRHVADRGVAVEPVADVDEDALADAVAGVAGAVDTEPVEGAVTFVPAGYEVVEATPGTTVDTEGAADALASAWPAALEGDVPVALPSEEVPPVVDAEAVADFVTTFAGPATAAPLPVVVGTLETEVPVDALAPTLIARVGSGDARGTLEPDVDDVALREALLEVEPDVDGDPTDARLEIEGGEPVVVPSATGRSVDAEALGTAALTALAAPAGAAERVARVPSAEVAPEVSTADVEALGVVEEIAEFSTPLSGSNPGRLQNIRVGTGKVDGTLVRPGETFDLNEVLGRRTAAAGYARASIIADGRYVESYGGGVSQISTTVYNAAFFAGMELVTHKPHSFYISRYPEGREATLDYDTIDMIWRNDTSTGVLVQAFTGGGELTVRFWGTDSREVSTSTSPRRNITQPESSELDSDDCIPSSPSSGFQVTVTRQVTEGGRTVHDDSDTVTYTPVPGITCV